MLPIEHKSNTRTFHTRSIIRLLFIITLLMMTSAVYADVISLRVLAKGSGDPVNGATVVLLDSEEFMQSDRQGQVEFTVTTPPSSIKILAPGYETLKLPYTGTTTAQTVYLVPIAYEAESLQVTADRLPEKISKFSFSAEELSNAAGSQGDPIVAVNTLPGIVTANEGRGQAYMRGSDLNDNQSFIDRVPIGYLYHVGDMRSTVNPSLVSDLNIFLGGFPVEYGDSLGGVIDVKLRPAKVDRRHYNVSISTIETSFLVEGPVGSNTIGNANDSFFVAGRRSYLDLLFSPSKFTDLTAKDEGESDRFITVPRYSDFQAKYRRQLDQGYLDYYYYMAADKIELENRSGIKVDPQTTGDTRFNIGFNTLGVSLHQQLKPDWAIDMPVTLFEQHQRFSLGMDDSGQPFFADNKSEFFLVMPKFDWQHTSTETISLGIDAGYYRVPLDLYISRPPMEQDGGSFYLSDQPKYRLKDTLTARAFGPYAKQRKKWTDKFTTEAGLRYTVIRVSGNVKANAASPRAAVEYQYTPATLLTASWGRYLQMPQGFQFIEGFGNPSLGFIESEHRIIGVERKFNELWSGKAELYHKPMDKLVVAVDGKAPPDNFAAEGTGEAYGLDLYIKRERRNGEMAWMSYSYSKSERTEKNSLGVDVTRRFSGDQPHNMKLVWSQPFTAGPFDWMQNWKRWTWGMTFQAHSGSLYTPIIGRELRDPTDTTQGYRAIVGETNSRRTPAYYRLDVRLEKELLRKESKMKIFLDIQNATLHQNVVGYDYGDELERIDNPRKITGADFFPFFGFEMEF